MDYEEICEYEGQVMKKITTLTLRDKWTTMTGAIVASAKGSVEQAKRVLGFVNSFRYGKVTLKSGNEGSIKVIRDKVVAMRKALVALAGSVPYHPESLGVAEEVVQDAIAQFRKSKNGIGIQDWKFYGRGVTHRWMVC